jgi:hypothetical protein
MLQAGGTEDTGEMMLYHRIVNNFDRFLALVAILVKCGRQSSKNC